MVEAAASPVSQPSPTGGGLGNAHLFFKIAASTSQRTFNITRDERRMGGLGTNGFHKREGSDVTAKEYLYAPLQPAGPIPVLF